MDILVKITLDSDTITQLVTDDLLMQILSAGKAGQPIGTLNLSYLMSALDIDADFAAIASPIAHSITPLDPLIQKKEEPRNLIIRNRTNKRWLKKDGEGYNFFPGEDGAARLTKMEANRIMKSLADSAAYFSYEVVNVD